MTNHSPHPQPENHTDSSERSQKRIPEDPWEPGPLPACDPAVGASARLPDWGVGWGLTCSAVFRVPNSPTLSVAQTPAQMRKGVQAQVTAWWVHMLPRFGGHLLSAQEACPSRAKVHTWRQAGCRADGTSSPPRPAGLSCAMPPPPSKC